MNTRSLDTAVPGAFAAPVDPEYQAWAAASCRRWALPAFSSCGGR